MTPLVHVDFDLMSIIDVFIIHFCYSETRTVDLPSSSHLLLFPISLLVGDYSIILSFSIAK